MPSSSSKGSQTLTNSTSSKSQVDTLSSHVGGIYSPDMPYSNTVSLPDAEPIRRQGLNKCSSDNDLESQIDSDQVDHPYSYSNNDSSKRKSVAVLASSGLPAYPTSSTSSPLNNHRQNQQGTSKPASQGLGVSIQRTQEVRSEVVPSNFNFVVASDEEISQEYKGLAAGKKSTEM